MTRPTDALNVISHVHWDREWYRGFDGYRGRLIDLVERVCTSLETDVYASFHLDGQTVVLADVLDIRPDLEPRIAHHVATGRLTVGPWHVLADNQLVSAENLVRNLFRARRWGTRIGRLSTVGYSPDAFGHPADLPRLLTGFGMDTAVVWRGAPPELARFNWVAPDGSEVFTVNQSYHQTEVLWNEETSTTGLRDYVDAERGRVPDGPWLLLNGGDHMVPQPPSQRTSNATDADVLLEESTLEDFFRIARANPADVPTVNGELRTLGDRLTFLLPGTLSARTYVKLANDRAQTLLERFAEPQLARHRLQAESGRHQGGAETVADADAGTNAGADDHRSLHGLLDHAWDLVIKNSPHDSICGCSIDEVHRATTVRAERADETGELLVSRLLLAQGLDTRRYGKPPRDEVGIAVVSGHGDVTTGRVVVDVATEVGRQVTGLVGSAGARVPFEVESTRLETVFEADLDLLPDSQPMAIHRLAFTARDVPAFGWTSYAAELGDATTDTDTASTTASTASSEVVSGRFILTVNPDASLRIEDRESCVVHDGVGRLVSTGDRGDTYNYDPPLQDLAVVPTVLDVRITQNKVRTRIVVDATMELPAALSPDRDSRSARTVAVPLTVTVEHWADTDRLDWTVTIDNRADDHRVRFEIPVDPAASTWSADQHWSVITRDVGPELGPLPEGPALEAAHPVAPVHSWATVGVGAGALTLLTRGLPEVQAFAGKNSSTLAVTVLRAVGWLSRFDLRTRTTGAGPMLAVPEAQCHGQLTAHLSVIVGALDEPLDRARAAALHRAPLRAYALRPGYSPPTPESDSGATPRVTGALVSAWKPVDQTTSGGGTVLRIGNPTADATTARVTLPTGLRTVWAARLDETLLAELPMTTSNEVEVELGPFGLETLVLR